MTSIKLAYLQQLRAFRAQSLLTILSPVLVQPTDGEWP